MNKDELKKILEGQKGLYIKEEDKIIFIVSKSYENALINDVFGSGHEIVIINDPQFPGEDYDLKDSQFEGKTVCWIISTVSLSHSSATKRMLDAGLFLISNPGITPDWAEALKAEHGPICARRADAILEAIGGNVGGKILLTNENQLLNFPKTSIELLVPNGNWFKEVGTREGFGTNGPFGEMFTAPYLADGIIVMESGDFLTNPINEILDPIVITIRDNMVKEIEGGHQASELKNMLSKPNDPKAYSLGEFAIQLNPARPEKIYRSVIAEKLEGGVHVAIGTNSVCLQEKCPEISKFKFGRYNAGVHIDCIMLGLTVKFVSNDRTVMLLNNGKLQF